MFIKDLTNLVTLLETYRGRDKIIRILTYVAMFMGADGKTSGQIKWRTVSGEFGAVRVILRLFDDLPMLLLNLSTSFGLKEKRPVIRLLNLISGLLNQGFYPTEHIAWLRQKKILNGEPRGWLLIGLFIWAASLTLEIIKSVLKLRYIKVETAKLHKQKELDRESSESGDPAHSQNAEIKQSLARLAKEESENNLTILHSVFDLVNAVSWMPPGFLWAGTLTPRTNGIIGMISSAVMLYKAWPTKS